MKTIKVNLKEKSYKIVIGEKILSRLGFAVKGLGLGTDAVIISSPNIIKLHGPSIANGLSQAGFNHSFIPVPDGEKSKSAETAISLLENIAQHDVKKKSFIVALGGGVIGDLSGFVAAVYKRGIPYIQVPTTLLAQIDSAIGGKTAIDLRVGKNLVGAFYQPRIVYSDIEVLKTLSEHQIRNGLAEAIKYGVIKDKTLFHYIEKNFVRLLSRDAQALSHVVFKCSQIKARVVAQDEKETKGIRTILNFGHTVGHAIEAAGKFSVYEHGEAVALGMRVAVSISEKVRLLSKSDANAINQLISDVGLPKRIRNISLKDILSMMQHDKKFKAGRNRFVLAKRIGQVKVQEGVSSKFIAEAIAVYF
ncbi:MAG: 3-dehydroquinate synthase [Omnitrophica WOR_2 bacterium GWA2_47_8]|nr:MAG: 3-dehydroquinate synthase [Omnitrophica WOR_2 bacterium GWA2_47_8]